MIGASLKVISQNFQFLLIVTIDIRTETQHVQSDQLQGDLKAHRHQMVIEPVSISGARSMTLMICWSFLAVMTMGICSHYNMLMVNFMGIHT